MAVTLQRAGGSLRGRGRGRTTVSMRGPLRVLGPGPGACQAGLSPRAFSIEEALLASHLAPHVEREAGRHWTTLTSVAHELASISLLVSAHSQVLTIRIAQSTRENALTLQVAWS